MDNGSPFEQQKKVMLGGGDNALTLPEQASNIRLQSSETPQEIFRNDLDALVDEPWGGVINTGSRDPAQSRLAFACRSSKCRR